MMKNFVGDAPQQVLLLEKTVTLISEITGIITNPSPPLAILSIGINNFPHNFRVLVMYILFASRLLIMHNWRHSTVSNLM